jgi:hypothetical protein
MVQALSRDGQLCRKAWQDSETIPAGRACGLAFGSGYARERPYAGRPVFWMRFSSKPRTARLRGSFNATNSSYINKTLHASEQHREDVAKAREEWKRARPALDPDRIVFIDETGTNTQMTRMRGRCQKGSALRAERDESRAGHGCKSARTPSCRYASRGGRLHPSSPKGEARRAISCSWTGQYTRRRTCRRAVRRAEPRVPT